MENQKGFASILLIAVATILIGGGTFYYMSNQESDQSSNDLQVVDNPFGEKSKPRDEKLNHESKDKEGATFCTADAKQCPDGSYVGRTGPSCEFVCPEISDNLGIVVTFPKEESLTNLPINVKGYVSDVKKWTIFESNVGSVELYGNYKGAEKRIGVVPLSLVDFDYDKEPPFYFDVWVGDRQWISELDNEKGYILIKEDGVKDNVVTDEIKVPLIFDIPEKSKIIDLELEKNLDFGEVYHYLEGEKGLILCFHGKGGAASGWSNVGTDKNDFLIDFAEEGWSFICPTSEDRNEKQWDDKNNRNNFDIQNVDNLVRYFGKSFASIILVGHSNGGGFATRYAAFSEFSNSIDAIQLSNASGMARYLQDDSFNFPILFNYADCDPVVSSSDVRSNQAVISSKIPSVSYINNELDSIYLEGEYEHCHEFVNTGLKVLELVD